MRLRVGSIYLHRIKTNVICCLVIAALISGLFAFTKELETYGYTEKAGRVTGVKESSSLNVRDDAGTTGTQIIGRLKNGALVTIKGEKNARDGSLWYNIYYADSGGHLVSGYIHSSYVELLEGIEYTPDEDFEEYLIKQGFPESYKDSLRLLHAKYPNWVFTADKIAIDFNEAVENEYKINPSSESGYAMGRSLIALNSISSWKSTDVKAYNWNTGKWYGFDGDGWVAASRELVAYSLDPRNFLDDVYIFQFESISYQPSFQNIEGLQNLMKGSFLETGRISDDNGGTLSYGEALMNAAMASGASPVYLGASIIQELGSSGDSGSISGSEPGYEGYYNYYNIGAYDGNGRTAIQNGLIYAKKEGWDTPYKALVGGAVWMARNYISIGQDTLYYKKFDFVGTPYTHQYMTHIIGARQESVKSAAGYTDEMKKNLKIVFKIPVFENMPDLPCPIPTADGSPNNVLISLSAAETDITPTFSMFTQEYSAIVDYGVSKLTVQAQAADKSAVVSGTGEHALNVGSNNITVTVTAANGSVRSYNIAVVRQESTEEFSFSADGLFMNDETGTVTGVSLGMGTEELMSKYTVSGGSMKITDANGGDKDGIVCTGDKVKLYKADGSIGAEYTIVIYGDVNGDGAISVKDALMVRKHILDIEKLSGTAEAAANVNKENDGITVKDALIIRKHILGIESLSQN